MKISSRLKKIEQNSRDILGYEKPNKIFGTHENFSKSFQKLDLALQTKNS